MSRDFDQVYAEGGREPVALERLARACAVIAKAASGPVVVCQGHPEFALGGQIPLPRDLYQLSRWDRRRIERERDARYRVREYK